MQYGDDTWLISKPRLKRLRKLELFYHGMRQLLGYTYISKSIMFQVIEVKELESIASY